MTEIRDGLNKQLRKVLGQNWRDLHNDHRLDEVINEILSILNIAITEELFSKERCLAFITDNDHAFSWDYDQAEKMSKWIRQTIKKIFIERKDGSVEIIK